MEQEIDEYKASIPVSQKGCANELAVVQDLLARGYNVFRAIGDHSPCDLVALKNGCCYKIEVKSVNLNLNGELILPWREGYGTHDFDFMAFISKDGQIIYMNKAQLKAKQDRHYKTSDRVYSFIKNANRPVSTKRIAVTLGIKNLDSLRFLLRKMVEYQKFKERYPGMQMIKGVPTNTHYYTVEI